MLCEKCGKEFTPKYVSPSRRSLHPPRFCSKECGQTNRSNGDQVPCTQCGKLLYRRKSYLSATRDPFCDHKCYGNWMKVHRKVGKADLREYRYHRNLALVRDNYTCQDCGKNIYETPIITHHIVEVGPDHAPDHRYTNLVSLCLVCHRKRHHK